MQANCIFVDDVIMLVLCPYCDRMHKHGIANVGSRSAHCGKGEYTIGEVFSDQFILQAFKQHQMKLKAQRKKVESPPKFCNLCSAYDEKTKEVRPLYGAIGTYYCSDSNIPCPGCNNAFT